MHSHLVDVTLCAVATCPARIVMLPVVPAGDKTRVSVVIASVIVPALTSFSKEIIVPIGHATFALLSIVQVLAVVSADG